MANQVYANNMEVSCKAANGKSVAAFPDVCFTPPQTPATPPGVPIPYPNTGLASDTTNGSRSVKISKKEVMLKNKSYFKKSYGDEAGCAPKKGIITSRNMGKVYFNAWSMNVRIEGENAVRMMDITTHNHGSFPGNSPTWPYIDEMAFSANSKHPCASLARNLENSCASKAQPFIKTNKAGKSYLPPHNRKAATLAMCNDEKGQSDCRECLKCVLTPKSPNHCCSEHGGQQPTPHHIVPDSQFKDSTGHPIALGKGRKYRYAKAPCICAEGNSHSTGRHGEIHTETNNLTINNPNIADSFISTSGKTFAGEPRWSVSVAEDGDSRNRFNPSNYSRKHNHSSC